MTSDGAWNAAHFKNPEYDALVAQYVATADAAAQRALAGKIETLLLDETPVIFAYFYDYLAATASGVKGVTVTAMGQVYLQSAAVGA